MTRTSQEQGNRMQIIEARTIETRRTVVRRMGRVVWLPVLAAVTLAGCQVKKTEAPTPTGPSALGLTLDLRAIPDVVTMDGLSQSQLTITAFDPNGRPMSNQGVRVEITDGAQIVDIGRLSSKNVTTGSDGRATVTYTAPAGPPSQNSDLFSIITLIATPAGYDYRNALSRQVDIRLVPQGVILPQAFAPLPRFTFSPTNPNEGAEVTFDASASVAQCPDPSSPTACAASGGAGGSITSYVWDFGDGTTGSGVRTQKEFDSAGTFVVRLTVTNDRGLSNSVTATVTVAGVAAPTANFASSPGAPAVNQTVFFDASASTAAAGRSIVDYSWTFGDGGTGSGVTTSHRYTRQGAFNVTLTVTDSGGKTGARTGTVTVGAGLLPTADFSVSPTSPAVNQRVFFDGSLSTAPAGRTITRYVWNLGDNTIVEGVRVDHVYSARGGYTVLLTVTDSSGATHTASKAVTVQ